MNTDYGFRRISLLTRRTLALILAGGRGSRLKHLTLWRAKPATPFGGKFRIIDFPLSNCINSGIRQIAVLTQYKAHSLILHIQKGWGFLRGEFGEYVELLPAQQRVQASWYQGTADAVFQNLDIIRAHDPEFVLILGGDHIYKMDYGTMIAAHETTGADVTVGCVEVTPAEARGLGVVSVDQQGRIVKFTEKPTHPEAVPGRPDAVLASMGIYVFNRGFLYEQIIKDADDPDSSHDFGKDIIPSIIDKYQAFAHRFVDVQTSRQNYWRDVGTVDAYWKANMELIGVTPELNIYDEAWPIWTYQEQLPPAKFIFDDDRRRGMAVDSMVSGGCIISGAQVKRSLLFSRVTINSYSKLDHSLILPNVTIGQNCLIHKTILDERCIVPDGTVIGQDPAADAERFYVTEGGVVLVTPQMLGQSVHQVR